MGFWYTVACQGKVAIVEEKAGTFSLLSVPL